MDRLTPISSRDGIAIAMMTASVIAMIRRRHLPRQASRRQRGRELMEKLITDLSAGVPKVLTELTTLGRTLKKRAADVLA
ncbi:ISL3 family transposase, partial [Arthrobacter sp. EH-1B-1]|nr:ISL3 family transposase [Arthrobacter vasquezii]